MQRKTIFNIFSVLLIAASFTSCSKKDNLSTSQQLSGKWTMDAAIGEYGYQGVTTRDTTTFTTSDYIQFNADSTLQISESSDQYAGSWSVIGNKLTITGTEYMDYPGGFTITKLTGNQLELYYHQVDGATTLTQTLKLKK